MNFNLRKKIETLASDNNIAFYELAELIGLEELGLVYYLEKWEEMPISYLAKLSQILNFNFFSLFQFCPNRGVIIMISPEDQQFQVQKKMQKTNAGILDSFVNQLEVDTKNENVE
ncbi:hypothetical protein [Rubrolithibacter danxiaensis]|uniref:hypothetical protein n=1 Tax=Rubrolithibacter danxiaensis TaxID=3390805 RepID=UPI003BF8AB52